MNGQIIINNLIPAVIQDANTNTVLMLGYMNQEALDQTLATKFVTFFSRSKNRLWMKGETSGNKLAFVSVSLDCDQDTLLIKANPMGPVCHNGTETCFDQPNHQPDLAFIHTLEKMIQTRDEQRPEKSYTTELFNSELNRMAQKVGEEGVEVVIAALQKDDKELCGEAADLLFHLLVLLRARKLKLSDIINVLRERVKK